MSDLPVATALAFCDEHVDAVTKCEHCHVPLSGTDKEIAVLLPQAVAIDNDWVSVSWFRLRPPRPPALVAVSIVPGRLDRNGNFKGRPPASGSQLGVAQIRANKTSEARELLKQRLSKEAQSEVADPLTLALAREWAGEFSKRPRTGRAGRDDRFYAQIARQYVDAIRRGSGKPVEDVAAQTKYNASTIRDMLHRARRRGLLTPAGQGKAGGNLTKRAERLLETHQNGDQNG